MITTLTCKRLEMHQAVEDEIALNAPKIEKLLKRYAPDVAKLHAAFDRVPRKVEFQLSLTLSLPLGKLHATGTGTHVRASVKKAFGELEAQLKKHQQKLRKDYEWKRKRPLHKPATADEAPAAD